MIACTVIAVVVLAQFPENGGLYNQELQRQNDYLDFVLENHPDLENIFFPEKYMIPKNFYAIKPTTDYLMSVVFDPCRGHSFDCCHDTYGTPEWRQVDSNPTSPTFGADIFRTDTGALMTSDASRLPQDGIVIDESCTAEFTPDPLCLASRVRRVPYKELPRCWNFNETILAGTSCRAPRDGAPLGSCLELGFSQTAYIIECGGRFKNDPHCGTFLEIHRPGDNTSLAVAKLRGQLTSGYRMTVISTTFKGNSSRLLCKGDHELWWVLRTRSEWEVQRKMPFRIVSPVCDWDPINNRFEIFATTATAVYDFDQPMYNPANFNFSRYATAGTPGYPAKGMGSTLLLPNENNTLPSPGGAFPGYNVPNYVPSRPTIPEFTTAFPTHPLDANGLPIVP